MTVSKVEVELFFPLSRAVDRKTTGRIRLVEDITQHELLESLLMRLTQRYHGLQDVFDVETRELHPFAMVVINNCVLTASELPGATLNDGDEVSLLPQHVGGQG